jgi:homoserine dehydrogenase
MKDVKIGLFGFGTVGAAFCKALQQHGALGATIQKIGIKNSGKARPGAPCSVTTHASELLNDAAIDVFVELIDDAEAAYHIVKQALQKGKPVISANKKMIAAHLPELMQLQQQYKVPLLYEASCCAGLPAIRLLEQCYIHELPHALRGIVNGTTNFILSKMHEGGIAYQQALTLAIQQGFAEANPINDTGGYDALSKLRILLAHGLGITDTNIPILFTGITHISPQDVAVAHGRQAVIKLVAGIYQTAPRQYAAFVLPQWVPQTDMLNQVNNEYNGLLWESSLAGNHFYCGKGAGGDATASAVLSDVAAFQQGYSYAYSKAHASVLPQISNNYFLNVYVSVQGAVLPSAHWFEWITEQHVSRTHSWLIAVVHAHQLLQNDWWKQAGVSLIVLPNAIAGDVAYKKISAKSLQLAGAHPAQQPLPQVHAMAYPSLDN